MLYNIHNYDTIVLQIFSVSKSISCSPDWPQIQDIGEDDLELPICAPAACLLYEVLGTALSSLYNTIN